MSRAAAKTPGTSSLQPLRDELVAALRRLDARLEQALSAFDQAQGGPVRDRFRGLYTMPDQARALLGRAPGTTDFDLAAADGPLWAPSAGTVAERLASTCALSSFDLDVLLIAFAPEFDLRYERLYAYLQDDVTRKRPTVDLVLKLLCADDLERIRRREAFASHALLRREELIELVDDPNQARPPLLSQYVVVAEQPLRLLVGDSGLDSRLASCCLLEEPKTSLASMPLPDDVKALLSRVASSPIRTVPPLWVTAPSGSGKKLMAEAVARERRVPLLTLDGARVAPADLATAVRRARREASWRDAVLYIRQPEAWIGEPAAMSQLAHLLSQATCLTIVGTFAAAPADVLGTALPVVLSMPAQALRAECWRQALAANELGAEGDTIAVLARRFRLTPAQIAAAAADASRRRTWYGDSAGGLLAAARAQSDRALRAVADQVVPRATWDDLVLPPDAIAQLRELCQRVEHRDRVLYEWGFARKSQRGLGVNALFAGSSGTGKTMAAEVIANALGLDLYRIDLARVVSKYIGETEKNLDRVFTAAADANAILLFDEADALFGKRSEVKDSHDRYANIEISYLLQKMEEYDGVAILATNLAQNLDQAFTRRLAFHVHFPFPDEAARLQIWQRSWPAEVPLADSLELRTLARDLKLAGGGIRNVTVAAAFLAAADDGTVGAPHISVAALREFQKGGRSSAHRELP